MLGPLEGELQRILPPNVELRGWLSRSELAGLYATAAGFVHVAEEDFGISMVEALAAGTPVIALNRGGARDIVRHGIDGLLVDHPDVSAVREAVDRVATGRWDRAALAARAGEFSTERFIERMSALLARLGSRRATS